MKDKSYSHILKSTFFVGGSQVIQIFLSVLKTKVGAVFLGPTGIGLIGIYQSILDLIRNATGFGINFSGVKNIAQEKNNDNLTKLSEEIVVLKRWAIGTGILGALIIVGLSVPLSIFSFGDNSKALIIASLSIAVFFLSISACQSTILQGLQNIKKMALVQIVSASLSTVSSILLYVLFSIKGVIISIIISPLISYVIASLFIKKINIKLQKISVINTFDRGLDMAKMGFFLTINTLLSIASMYFLRNFILTKSDLATLGCFQAAWTITNSYIGIMLNSLVTDYYPRLCAVNSDDKYMVQLVNEQASITLLLGSLVVLLCLIFSGLMIQVLFTKAFSLALGVLQWQMFGTFFTLLYWPLGVIQLAKGKGGVTTLIDIITTVFYILIIVLFWSNIGFIILGYAYAARCFLAFLLNVHFSKKTINFSYSSVLKKDIIILTAITMVVFVLSRSFTSNSTVGVINILLYSICFIYSLIKFNKIINIKSLLKRIGKRLI